MLKKTWQKQHACTRLYPQVVALNSYILSQQTSQDIAVTYNALQG